ncbi:uncharacterized oxidoreductase TM_0325-like [Sitodiplosis mosellana]|uniref:uncharacterized oxidoreductase TM_0325-like n=1 Tax=Sitodiplosis mosellana TaxID=263140 RepID=UPI00244527FE|nr:uncharacterized oxidoreductase TM_0325-like [Sitodiplosis mosellana]
MSFEGKIVLITGASSGIGAAAAVYFAQQGALLALVGRNAERAESVAAKIRDSGVEVEPLVILADITVDSERIISETIEKYGRLDVLINNAAFGVPGSIETTRIEDYDAIFSTNVRGTFLLTQLAVPHLLASKGNIVNVSSVCGMRTFPILLAYCMSKAALDQFTQCVAVDLADRGVRVNCVSPGVVDTNFHEITLGFNKDSVEYAAIMDQYANIHPMKRIGQTDECVNAIAFLANENTAAFITGTLLTVELSIVERMFISLI